MRALTASIILLLASSAAAQDAAPLPRSATPSVRLHSVLPETGQALVFDQGSREYLLIRVGSWIGEYLVRGIYGDQVLFSDADGRTVFVYVHTQAPAYARPQAPAATHHPAVRHSEYSAADLNVPEHSVRAPAQFPAEHANPSSRAPAPVPSTPAPAPSTPAPSEISAPQNTPPAPTYGPPPSGPYAQGEYRELSAQLEPEDVGELIDETRAPAGVPASTPVAEQDNNYETEIIDATGVPSLAPPSSHDTREIIDATGVPPLVPAPASAPPLDSRPEAPPATAKAPLTPSSPSPISDDAYPYAPDTAQPQPGPPPPPSAKPARPARAQIDRRDMNAALSDFAQLSREVQVEPASQGFRVTGLARGSMAYRLGLRQGDEVLRVAGVDLRSLADAALVYSRVQSAKMVEVALKRRGVVMTILVEISG